MDNNSFFLKIDLNLVKFNFGMLVAFPITVKIGKWDR